MTAERRNLWVLGGTGFLGDSLVRVLSNDPLNRLHLLIHKTIPYKQLEEFNAFKGGLSQIDKCWFTRYPPKVIFHLARPAGSFYLARKYNTLMGEIANARLVNTISQLDIPPIVVYVSGSLMYGNRTIENPAFEGEKLYPLAYAKHYYRLERPWLEAQKNKVIDVRFARPGWIVGTSSWFRTFFWEPYSTNGRVPCYGDGNQIMSLVHRTDCARIIDSLSKSGSSYEDLNVFSGKPVSQLEFSATLADILGAKVERVEFKKVKREYGLVVANALTSSIPMGTRFPQVINKANVQHTDLRGILFDIIRLLEDEKGVFSKTPKEGFA
jgi:nucleoside-diphosphate-sugar epimerase